MSYVKYRILQTTSGCSSPDAAKLRESLFALKVVCHPVRFRILLRLADGALDAEQLKEELHSTAGFLSSYLTPLQHAGLVKTCQHENHKCYCLTEVGLKTVRYVLDAFGAACETETEMEAAACAADAPAVAQDGSRGKRGAPQGDLSPNTTPNGDGRVKTKPRQGGRRAARPESSTDVAHGQSRPATPVEDSGRVPQPPIPGGGDPREVSENGLKTPGDCPGLARPTEQNGAVNRPRPRLR